MADFGKRLVVITTLAQGFDQQLQVGCVLHGRGNGGSVEIRTESDVIDADGNRRSVAALVITEAANAARRESRLVAALERIGAFRRARVGNTRLAVLDCRTMLETVDRTIEAGDSFFADGKRIL